MARLISRIIEAARDRHPSFTPTAHPPGVLMRRLANWIDAIQGRLAQLDPGLSGIELTLSYALPLANFDDGLSLGGNRAVTEVTLVDPPTVQHPGSRHIQLISRDQRFFWNHPTLAAWQEGNILYLRGPATSWANVTGTIQVQVIAPFGDVEADLLLAPTAVLPLPDAFASAASAALAHLMAMRSTPVLTGLDQELAQAESRAFDDYLSKVVAGRSFVTGDVWRP
jgi:hypothetical protein